MPDFPLVINNALDRPGIYGDQREFVNIGVGAIRLLESEENEDILNNENDTWEKIDYSYLAQMTRVNLVAVANWAGAPNPPEPPTVTGLGEGNYQVRWEVDPFARGYAVSFRPFGQLEAPDYRFVSATENGLLEAVGLDPNLTYAVSIAPIGLTGRLGGFSKETLVIPTE